MKFGAISYAVDVYSKLEKKYKARDVWDVRWSPVLALSDGSLHLG